MLIGTFSKYVKTTVKTLRYYDCIGLFCPAKTDPATGYRRYTVDQVSDFEQIRQYRSAGFSVEQISRLLKGESREVLFQERQQEILKQAALLREQKEAMATLCNSPSINMYSVHLKQLPTYTVCTCSLRTADAAHIATACSASYETMKQTYPTLTIAQPNYCCVTFTDTSHHDTDIEVEYSEAVTSHQQDKNGFIFKTLPGGTIACVEHRGPYENIAGAYAALLRWITANGRQMSGSVRERFIHGAWDRDNELEWLTEIQVPLEEKND